MTIIFRNIFFFAIVLLNPAIASSLSDTLDNKEIISDKPLIQRDSLDIIADTLETRIENDTLKARASSGLDTTVVSTAKDSLIFDLKNKTLRLRGEAVFKYKEQKMEAEVITIDFNKSLMEAYGMKDTNDRTYGFPQFTDKGEVFVGEKFSYNYKTNKGKINLGETEMTEGYYYGEKIKRVSPDDMFVQDGRYTTCDDPNPHYYFGSPEMKVVAQDKVFLDPIIFYVEDLPVFILPVGLYFPNKTGRQSGIVIPSFFFSKNRGVTFENLGVYLALSEYYDTQFLVDLYSKGGFNIKNNTRWEQRYYFSGEMNAEFGYTRYNPDEEYTKNWGFSLRHNHTIIPQKTNITINTSFSSQDLYRNTRINQNDRLTQLINSNASLSHAFDNGASLSLSYSRSQNIITDTYDQTMPRLNFSLPQIYPLKGLVPSDNWLSNLTFNYNFSGLYQNSKKKEIKVINTEETSYTDTTDVYPYTSRLEHRPNISYSLPKLGYFSITPSFNFSMNNYFRRLTRTFNATDSTINDSYEHGFFTEYDYSLSLNVSTRLYGIVNPKLLGINSVRHTLEPSVSFVYKPDLSENSNGFYDEYYDDRRQDYVQYSRFATDGGGIASRYLSQSISYSLGNTFEAKIAQGDTLDDKNLQFLRLDLSGSYNFAADSLRLSDISVNYRTPEVAGFSFNGNASLTPYDEQIFTDPVSGIESYRKVDQLRITNGKGLFRLTRINFRISTSFSSDGFGGTAESRKDTTKQDSIGLGERFRQRIDHVETDSDYYGDNSPGYAPISIPWNVSFGLNYNFTKPTPKTTTKSLNLNVDFSFNLTETWSFRGGFDYDFINNELLRPQLQVHKDIHCWELDLTWYPIGYNQGFYLRFGIKASHLKDLKIEDRSSPIY
jgi:hypothetical protein